MGNALKLDALSPCAGVLPLKIGKMRVEEVTYGTITSLSPFAGKAAAVSKALTKQIDLPLPEIGQSVGVGDARVVWAGRAQFLILGTRVTPMEGAALTDQSDAWACIALEGPRARDVLARLTPVDLRETHFPEGAVARSLIGHMSGVLIRSGVERYEIMVFRSMARSLVHDLKEALETVAAVAR